MRGLVFALLLAACAAPQMTPSAPFALDGTTWQRTDDDQAAPHFPTLQFSDGGASGYSGCNRWFATVTQNRSALRFGGVGSTEMACAPPAMGAEQRMFDALNRTAAYRVDAEELTLLDANGDVAARFVRGD